jgi:hypothetical protein
LIEDQLHQLTRV